MPALLEQFQLRQRGSTVGRELRGAVATFLTMAYILFVNAQILSGVVPDDVKPSLVACTALAAGMCSIAMGWFANFPIALASGMGLNAIVAAIAMRPGANWRIAMGIIVL